MMPPTVTVLGSCRVHDPIHTLHQRGLVRKNTAGMNAYTHNTADCLQQIGVREGRLTIPAALSPLVFDREVAEASQFRALGPRRPSATDVAVIEISTPKTHSCPLARPLACPPLETQSNHAHRHLVERYGSTPELRQYWIETARSKRDQALIDSLLPAEMPEELRAAARLLTVRHHTADEILLGMRRIAAMLPIPLVWVSHNLLPAEKGAPLAQRQVVTEAVRRGAEELGHIFLDPTPHVLAFGQERAMAENGRDLAHYSREYLPVFGDILLERIRLAMAQEAAAPAHPA